MKKKGLVIAASVMLVLCLAVGGTLAWLSAETGPVVNTFTYGDINITLDEADADNSTADKDRDQANSYKMIPGNKITKDPKVTVEANSEACYLFVKVEKNSTYDTYLENYAVSSEWTPLDGVAGVYYRTVNADIAKGGVSYYVLNDNTVTVKTSVTKAQMENLNNGTAAPTLTFTAYAVQSDNVADAATAWKIATGVITA